MTEEEQDYLGASCRICLSFVADGTFCKGGRGLKLFARWAPPRTVTRSITVSARRRPPQLTGVFNHIDRFQGPALTTSEAISL